MKELRELYPEPVPVLEKFVFILCIKLVPVFGCLSVVGLDEFLRDWVQTLACNLVSCVLFLFLAPCCVVPILYEFQVE
jgi:hypothetical protein